MNEFAGSGILEGNPVRVTVQCPEFEKHSQLCNAEGSELRLRFPGEYRRLHDDEIVGRLDQLTVFTDAVGIHNFLFGEFDFRLSSG